MGEKRLRKQRFFEEHPLCCFCGGETAATTEDHQPARVFFQGRQWPEGFVFPACEPCNKISSESEKLVSLLIHGESGSGDRSKYQNLIMSIRREHPDLISSMLPRNANDTRRILRRKGISKPQGIAFRDIPIVSLDSDFWAPHFELFARKILLALHYQCFGEALSSNGKIDFWIHTNVDQVAGKFPKEIIELAQNLALPARQKAPLHEQFAVRWSVVPQHSTALFATAFHGRFFVSGITTETPEVFASKKTQAFMSEPFRHEEHCASEAVNCSG